MRAKHDSISGTPPRDPATLGCGHQERSQDNVDSASIRLDQVGRVRAALADGSYDEEELLDRALDSLAVDLGRVCRENDEQEG